VWQRNATRRIMIRVRIGTPLEAAEMGGVLAA
jgi:hypothetical protein